MFKKLIFAGMLFMLALNFSATAQEPSGDLWIKQIYWQVYLRPPSAWEYNIKNYNLGTWNNYGDLLAYIVQYQTSLNNEGLTVKTTNLGNNQVAAVFYQSGTAVAGTLISNDAGKLIGNDGSTLIGNDGSTLISVDHARLIGLDGSTLKNLSSVSFADMNSKNLLAAGNRHIKAAGRGRIVFKKRKG